MAFLQWSDVRAMWRFEGPFTGFAATNGLAMASGSFQYAAFLRAGLKTVPQKDLTTNYKDADSGYRASYGRHYNNGAAITDVYTTGGVAGFKEAWDGGGSPLISFTYGFVFRDNSTSTGSGPGRVLMSKPTTTSVGTRIGNQLAMDDVAVAGQFGWRCFQQNANQEVATIPNVPKFKWIIGYVIKPDGVASKIGLKMKGDASWTTATATGSPITVDYDTTKNAALMGQVNKDTDALQSPFWGDLQAFCIWGVAITESTVQSDLEDHFGRADTIVAVQRSSILS